VCSSDLGVPGLDMVLVWAVALTTLASGAAYVRAFNTAWGGSGGAGRP